MSKPVRYIPGDADGNAVLRLALLEAWAWRCYLCRTPHEFGAIEIDHILPHTLPTSELKKLLQAHVIPAPRAHGFDLHAAYNLAPICRSSCNGAKGSMNLAGSGLITVKLERARMLAPRVEKFVRSFRSSNVVTKAILAVSTADLSDAGSNSALSQFAPLVVNRLSLLAPMALAEYKSVHRLDDPTIDAPRVLITLDEAGRRARVILEDVVGQNFDEALCVPIRELEREIERRVESEIGSKFDWDVYGEPTVGPPSGRKLIEIDKMTYGRHEETFGIRGTFDVDMSSLVAIVGNDGSTDYVQSDAAAHGMFTGEFWDDDGKLRSGDINITDWRPGPAPW